MTSSLPGAAEICAGASSPGTRHALHLLISLIILSFNLFGDGLRDAFDPKLKN